MSNEYIDQLVTGEAQLAMAEAYANTETPEQTALRFQKARRFEMPPEQVDSLTPEEEAAKVAQAVDWAALNEMAPVLTERLSDPAFANLVKDDLTNTSMVESAIWSMAPEIGEKSTLWGTIRNAFTRGQYGSVVSTPIIGSLSKLEALKKEQEKIQKIKAAYDEGKDVRSAFATAEDDTGEVGLKAFLVDYDRINANLTERIQTTSETIGRVNQYAQLFPSPQVVRDFMQASSGEESMARFAESPLMIMADIGVSSAVQQAPALLAMGLAAPLGVGAVAGASGLSSLYLDANASFLENLQTMGVDLNSPQSIVDAFNDPEKRTQLEEAKKKANLHALPVALLDALSAGLASKSLVPKSIAEQMIGNAYRREFSEVAIQMPLQGALGGAGEALGQLSAEGEITSWSNVIAEVVGEHFTAPVEVMTTGMKARMEMRRQTEDAQRQAQAVKDGAQALANSQLAQLDEETALDQIRRVADKANVKTVSFDAEAFHQHRLDRKFSDIPEIAAQVEKAKTEGGRIVIPTEVFMTRMAPNDDGLLAELVAPGDGLSVAESQEQETATEEAFARQAQEAANLSSTEFKAGVAEVGRIVGKELRASGASNLEAKSLQAIIQTQVANLAESLGVNPSQVWSTYGARILGEPNIQRNEQGEITTIDGKAINNVESFEMSSPVWDGDLQSFLLSDWDKGQFISEKMPSEAVKNFLGKGSDKVDFKITKDAQRHVQERHPEFTQEDWDAVLSLLDNAVGGYVNGDRTVMFTPRGDGQFIEVAVKVGRSERRASKGKNGMRVSLVSAYVVDENTMRSQLINKKKQTLHPGTDADLPSDNDDYQWVTSPSASQDTLSQKEGALSSGDYLPSLKIIARWKNANRSTLLHETAHLFLDMRMNALADLLASGQPLSFAQQQFVNSMQDVMAFIGVKSVEQWQSMTVDQQRKAHEKFARSFEAYVMEGKAPTGRLQEAFRAFSQWLKNIYHVMANIPEAEINDDVREMFDAMFASDEQVREATMRQNTQSLFSNPEEVQLTIPEWNEYARGYVEVVQDAKAERSSSIAKMERAVSRLRNKMLRELKGEVKGRLAQIKEEEWARMKLSKEYNAWHVLRHGREYDGEKVTIKLYVGDLKALGYSEEEIQKLYKARLATKQRKYQPVSAEMLAEDLGFDDSTEMVTALLQILNPTQTVNERIVNRMLEERPEFNNEARMRALADASIFNDAKVKVVSMELKALERFHRKEAKDMKAIIEEMAYQTIGAMKITEVKPKVYVRQANMAARRAREAFMAGNMDEAIRFKRQELYQTCLAKEAKASLMELAKSQRHIKKTYFKKTIKGMDTAYLETIQRALANMGFRDPEKLWLNDSGELFSKEVDALPDGSALDASPELIVAIDAKDSDYIQTVGGFRQFVDLLGQLETRGRHEMQIATVEGKQALEEVQRQSAEVVRVNAQKHGREAKLRFEESGKKAQFRDLVSKIGLNHARASTLMSILDGEDNGILTQLVTYTVDKANSTKEKLNSEMLEKLLPILEPIEKGLRDKRAKTSNTLGIPLTTENVFVMLLNVGNDGNRQRLINTIKFRTDNRVDLLEGFDLEDPAQYELAQAKVDSVLRAVFAEYLDKEHYEAAQKIWDLFDDLKDQTSSVARSMNGRTPLWVKPREFIVLTKEGPMTLRGGYYPIRYDNQQAKGQKIQESKTIESMKSVFDKHGVSDGHLQNRASDVTDPLALTTRAMFEGADEQIHYIAFARWVEDMRKLFDEKGELAQAIVAHYGRNYYEAIKFWVNDTRNGNRNQTQPGDEIANILRKNVSLAGTGFNLTTALLQFTGYTQSVIYLGGKWSARGMGEFLKMGPMESIKWIATKSPMMKNRASTQFREISEVHAELNSGGGAWAKFQRMAYLPITFMQMMVDAPTWLGAYQKALSEGASEAMAIAQADRAVINTQGSGRKSDLSAYERGGAWAKLFTVFYNYFNTVLNRAIVTGMVKDKMRASVDLMMMLVLAPVMEAFLREAIAPSGDDKDKKEKKDTLTKLGYDVLNFNLGLFVGLREIQPLFSDYNEYRGPAGLRKITDVFRAGNAIKSAIEKGEISESTVKASVSAMGSWLGLPSVPINRFISGFNALEEGETDDISALFLGYSK